MKRILVAALAALSVATPAHAEPKWKCPQWQKLAREVGFTRADWPRLDAILWRESRCRETAKGYNKRADGTVWSTDMGLSQINNYSWVTYLRKLGIIKHSDDLLHPRTNLRAAKALYDYSKSRGLDPWHQWRTSGSGSWNN
jgi:hypothetical protein